MIERRSQPDRLNGETTLPLYCGRTVPVLLAVCSRALQFGQFLDAQHPGNRQDACSTLRREGAPKSGTGILPVRRCIAGVTLVELIAAMALLSVLVILLFNVLSNSSAAWTAGQAQTERRNSARALGAYISRELQTALLPLDPTDPTTLQFTLNPPAIPADDCNPSALFWQAPIASDQSRGDVAETGYFLKWDTTVPSQPKPKLCRFFVNPTDANYLIYRQPATWLSAGILDAVAPADNVAGNAYRGLFSENVVGFWVSCYAADGKLLSTGGRYDSRVLQKLPRLVKIFLVMVDSRGLAKLHSKPDYSTAGAADPPDLQAFINALPDGVRQAAQSYTTGVYLENAQ